MKTVLGLSAALAVADAVLVPPGAVVASDFALIDPFSHLMKLECPGCRFNENQNEEAVSIQDNSASLLLNFSTAGTVLNLNGAQIYPPALTLGSIEPIYASEVATADSLADIKASPGDHLSKPSQISGYSLMIAGSSTAGDTGDELIPVTLTITGMEGRPVVVPSVTLHLLKNHNDASLMILDTETHAPPPPLPAGEAPPPPPECNDWPLMCKLRDMFESAKLALPPRPFKGCMKGKGHKGPGPHKDEKFGKVPHNLHHGPHSHHDGAGEMHKFKHPHGPHHGHAHAHAHKLHKVLHVVARVLAPVLIGVVAGMLAYIIGMHVGLLIGMLWLKFRARRAPPAYEELPQDEERIVSEKEVLIQEMPEGEAPPVYEEIHKEPKEPQEPVEKE